MWCQAVHTSLMSVAVGGWCSQGCKPCCFDFFIDTNLIHKFLYKLHKIKFLYMFGASSTHLQEVSDVNCTCMQPLVFYQRLHTCTINIIDLLKMSG